MWSRANLTHLVLRWQSFLVWQFDSLYIEQHPFRVWVVLMLSYTAVYIVHSWHYQIFREVMGLEPRPLSLASTIEELLERNISSSGLDTDNTAVGIHHTDHVAPSVPKSWH
jgi:hypothetical protein